MALTEVLLNEAKVGVVPGIAFGADRYIRLSYATSMENIKEGLERISNQDAGNKDDGREGKQDGRFLQHRSSMFDDKRRDICDVYCAAK